MVYMSKNETSLLSIEISFLLPMTVKDSISRGVPQMIKKHLYFKKKGRNLLVIEGNFVNFKLKPLV